MNIDLELELISHWRRYVRNIRSNRWGHRRMLDAMGMVPRGILMICPLHRTVYEFNTECTKCIEEGIKAISTEFDKQDRVIDTMRYMNYEFRPDRSRAVLIFDAPKEVS